MKTLIDRANDKGWTIQAGTLQAKGLFHAVRNNAATDNDVTVWCNSRNDAAREALNISAADIKNKPKKNKVWIVYDPRDRQYICTFEGCTCTWSDQHDKSHGFLTKAIAQESVRMCGYVPTRMIYTSREVRV